MVIVPSKAYSSKLFFFFPLPRSCFFLQSFGKKFVLERRRRIRALTRGVERNEDHFFFFFFWMEILVQLSRRLMSRHMRTFSPLFSFSSSPLPSSFSWIKVDPFLATDLFLFLTLPRNYRIIRTGKFVTP